MELKFRVAARVARPVHEVFEAVADPRQLSSYFTTGGASGRLEPGSTVTWDFHDYPGAFPVEVIELVPDEKIVLRWDAAEGEQLAKQNGQSEQELDQMLNIRPAGYKTVVTMTFTGIDGGSRTLVEVREEGWRETQGGLDASYGNCMGWAQMLCCLKVWLEHGFNLREGLYA